MRKAFALFALLCVIALVGCDGVGQAQDSGSDVQEPHVKKALGDYSWQELSEISAEIAAAEDDQAGREVAKSYGLVGEDGALSTDTKQIVLDGTRAFDVRLAGIRHDDKADGTGKAGLTFMSVGALDIMPMNETATVEGGWEASTLRAWLAGEARDQFEDDLLTRIVAVNKLTNNVGLTEDMASVTATADELWLFSAHEVCGDVHWDSEEFQGRRGYQDVDGLVNAEGHQYEAFASAGVTYNSDPNGFLSLAETSGAIPWWYRTPYPFDFYGYGYTGADGYFYQVRDSGYPESLGSPEVAAGVVFGFCV